MSTEVNKENSRYAIEYISNSGDFSRLNDLFAGNYTGHSPGMPEFYGPEGFRQFITMWRTAFPDLHMNIEDMIAEEETVVTFWTAGGTHRGELMGIPATGKSGNSKGMTLARYENGKQVEAWIIMDRLDMLQQLGVAPQMKQAVA